METRPSAYIAGRWRSGVDSVDVHDSVDGSVIASVGMSGADDVDDAVRAARAAFAGWSATSVEERLAMLSALADGLSERAGDIAVSSAREVGSILAFGERVQAGLPVAVLRTTIEAMRSVGEERIGNSRVRGLPIGVVAAITPWNYPLYQVVAKLAPALAAGCTAVIKPPQQAPLTAYILVEELERAGVPAGVVNVVQGRGSVVGEALSSHPDVDFVSFTGSTGAGATIAQNAARNVTKVALELGGKSATIVTEDADLDLVIPAAVNGYLVNNGQTCAAMTRLVVPRRLLGEIEDRLVAATAERVVGDPRQSDTSVGPMVSAAQCRSVLDYIRDGMNSSRLLLGGTDRPAELTGGHFVMPTIFSEVDPDARIAQEEIFGPVLVIHAVEGEDEAVAVANNSQYGLSGSVWTSDPEHGARLARRMRTGQVAVNGGAFNPAAPFGGFKQSGYGRELGRYGINEYLEPQSVQMP
ncbi:aldehyde dehydrogenase family protein [Dietzia lutea]|uniref:aldehyde dehydrogenase (NAD(+)) n=1 Tax=Dietzia lutea TaxID=546160 RepID=A0A2S1R9Y1_9ACTN|nr:aldehyde dehydrogenase family protein [Dietzia lutea]AWH93073.1 hypothetical protein A6035_13845 [Dietzia lutea]AWH93097.1 hypothetical protein A6035_13980 [Dietzia lutea]